MNTPPPAIKPYSISRHKYLEEAVHSEKQKGCGLGA